MYQKESNLYLEEDTLYLFIAGSACGCRQCDLSLQTGLQGYGTQNKNINADVPGFNGAGRGKRYSSELSLSIQISEEHVLHPYEIFEGLINHHMNYRNGCSSVSSHKHVFLSEVH